jgi:hypothetical protein
MLLSTPDMPTSTGYSSYTNIVAGIRFLNSISQYLYEFFHNEIKKYFIFKEYLKKCGEKIYSGSKNNLI